MSSRPLWTAKEGCLSNSYKMEEEGKKVTMVGRGGGGEEEREEEGYTRGGWRGEKNTQKQSFKQSSMPAHAPVHAHVSVHMWRGFTRIRAHVKETSESLLF